MAGGGLDELRSDGLLSSEVRSGVLLSDEPLPDSLPASDAPLPEPLATDILRGLCAVRDRAAPEI